MRITENRIPIIVAVIVALFLCIIPEATNAQPLPPPTNFDAQACSQQLLTAHTNIAAARTVRGYIPLQQPPISVKDVYCWSTLIQPIHMIIGAITSSGNGVNPFGGITWALIVNTALNLVTALANQICQAALAMMNQGFSYIKSLACFPLPSHQSSFAGGGGGVGGNIFGGLAGGTCQGVNLLNVLTGQGVRQTTPGPWSIWGLQNQY
jgi:hypothetical protein